MLFVVDASVGITDDEMLIGTWLRKAAVPILVVANKADNDRRESDRWEFLALGLGDPHAVSALHGRRAGDLLDEIVARIPVVRDDDPVEPIEPGLDADGRPLWNPKDVAPPRVAIVGRPNVGKSTLFNRLVGEDRSVVHDMAGTTRDAIDTLVETPDGPIVFVDTAGMRKRGQDRRLGRVLLDGACPAGHRRRRHRAAGHRCHRRCHGSGPASGRACRRQLAARS